MNNDLISREALKKAICDKGIKAICEKGIKGYEEYNQGLATALDLIDLAQPASDRYDEGYAQGYIDGSTGADWKGEDE